jgi:hypothetical protein
MRDSHTKHNHLHTAVKSTEPTAGCLCSVAEARRQMLENGIVKSAQKQSRLSFGYSKTWVYLVFGEDIATTYAAKSRCNEKNRQPVALPSLRLSAAVPAN